MAIPRLSQKYVTGRQEEKHTDVQFLMKRQYMHRGTMILSLGMKQNISRTGIIIIKT